MGTGFFLKIWSNSSTPPTILQFAPYAEPTALPALSVKGRLTHHAPFVFLISQRSFKPSRLSPRASVHTPTSALVSASQAVAAIFSGGETLTSRIATRLPIVAMNRAFLSGTANRAGSDNRAKSPRQSRNFAPSHVHEIPSLRTVHLIVTSRSGSSHCPRRIASL